LIELGSVKAACDIPSLPAEITIYKWLAKSIEVDAPKGLKKFYDQYVNAQEISADREIDSLLDDIFKNSKSPLTVKGEPVMIKGEPVMTITAGSVAYARLMYDATTWRAGRRNSKYLNSVKAGDGVDDRVPDSQEVRIVVENASTKG
jgi:hypothetical protein